MLVDAEVGQVRTQADLEKHCLSKSGPCLLVVLDENAEDHSESLTILRSLKENDHKKRGPFNFAWIEGSDASDISRQFDLADMRPNIVAFDQQKGIYRVMLGSWDIAPVEKFMGEVVSGKGRGNVAMSFTPRVVTRDEL